jgi:hypothetical protein
MCRLPVWPAEPSLLRLALLATEVLVAFICTLGIATAQTRYKRAELAFRTTGAFRAALVDAFHPDSTWCCIEDLALLVRGAGGLLAVAAVDPRAD